MIQKLQPEKLKWFVLLFFVTVQKDKSHKQQAQQQQKPLILLFGFERFYFIFKTLQQKGCKNKLHERLFAKRIINHVLRGNRQIAKDKGKMREGQDIVLAGKEQQNISLTATHEISADKSISAMEKVEMILKVQSTYNEGEILEKKGKEKVGWAATHIKNNKALQKK